MAERRRYSAKTRAKAAGIAVVEGVTEAERRTGIPKETIHYWLNKPEFAHLRTTARETVVEQFWVGVQVGVEQVIEGLKGDAPLNHKAEATRMLADRFALLNGEATTRTESITNGLDPEFKRELRERIARSAREESDTTGTGRDSVGAGTGLGSPSETGTTSTEG